MEEAVPLEEEEVVAEGGALCLELEPDLDFSGLLTALPLPFLLEAEYSEAGRIPLVSPRDLPHHRAKGIVTSSRIGRRDNVAALVLLGVGAAVACLQGDLLEGLSDIVDLMLTRDVLLPPVRMCPPCTCPGQRYTHS